MCSHEVLIQFAEKHLQSASMLNISEEQLQVKRKEVATKTMLFEGKCFCLF